MRERTLTSLSGSNDANSPRLGIERSSTSERLADLYAMQPFGFIAVNVNKVNLNDLLDYRPGALVRVFGSPQDEIKFFPDAVSPILGCIAGWVSEGDP